MSNLLNGIAAAAGSIVRRNSSGPIPNQAWKAMSWVYRNICWYGMQIQRYARRTKRSFMRFVRPIGKFFVSKVGVPAADIGRSTCALMVDTKKALGVITDSARAGGVKAIPDAVVSTASKGIAKHKTFLTGAVNHCLPIICIALLLTVALGLYNRSYALAVECGGVTVGYVSDENTYTAATELIGERVISTSEQFKSTLTPRYSIVPISDSEQLNSPEEICNSFLLNSDDVEEAYGLFVDDKLIGALRSEGDMTYILNKFLEQYRTGAKNETVSLVGNDKIVSGLYSTEKIMSAGDFQSFISATEFKTEVYNVKSGDTVSGILKKYDLTEERLYELNEGFTGDLSSVKTLLVEKEQPVLRVQNVIVSSYEKTIAYSTETIKDSTKYTNQKTTKTKGVNGVELVTQEIIYIDGVQVDTNIISREVLRAPVNEVVVVGTKKTTTTRYNSNGGSFSQSAPVDGSYVGTGRFTWPVPGVTNISSKYGYRWGRLHSGIDISTSGIYGRTIVAADSGTVTLVRNSPSGYGLYLMINHGNGYSTLYAHCSSILVSAGDKVSKGQAIAKVGNSGRSTGPHLHFEIRVNGTAKNPMNWF